MSKAQPTKTKDKPKEPGEEKTSAAVIGREVKG